MFLFFYSEGLNGLIPIIIGIGSGIGVLMVGVVVFFVLSKIRKGKGIHKFTTKKKIKASKEKVYLMNQ